MVAVKMTIERNVAPKPLDSFPIIRSRDTEEARNALIRTFGARNFDLRRGTRDFDVRANHWQTQSIGLSYCNYGAQVHLDFPEASFFRCQIGLHGTATANCENVQRQVTADQAVVIPPDVPLGVNFGPEFEQIVLRIDTAALMKKIAALIGGLPRQKLVFDQRKDLDGFAAGTLRRMIMFLATELDAAGPSRIPNLALAELEQALMISFLRSESNNYTSLIDQRARPAASWQARRAEEYIEAHWSEPITIEKLADVTSASASSIFYHFRRTRGQSPMAFLKAIRLQHARRMLASTVTPQSVTDTAVACGFSNLGHFARDYFERFGERPSDTLKRARGTLS
jgi:AraC-like DNA-binding protein